MPPKRGRPPKAKPLATAIRAGPGLTLSEAVPAALPYRRLPNVRSAKPRPSEISSTIVDQRGELALPAPPALTQPLIGGPTIISQPPKPIIPNRAVPLKDSASNISKTILNQSGRSFNTPVIQPLIGRPPSPPAVVIEPMVNPLVPKAKRRGMSQAMSLASPIFSPATIEDIARQEPGRKSAFAALQQRPIPLSSAPPPPPPPLNEYQEENLDRPVWDGVHGFDGEEPNPGDNDDDLNPYDNYDAYDMNAMDEGQDEQQIAQVVEEEKKQLEQKMAEVINPAPQPQVAAAQPQVAAAQPQVAGPAAMPYAQREPRLRRLPQGRIPGESKRIQVRRQARDEHQPNFVTHNIHITPAQQRRLLARNSIRLQPNQMGFDRRVFDRNRVHVLLTHDQYAAMQDAYRNQTPIQLQFDNNQIEMHGRGWGVY